MVSWVSIKSLLILFGPMLFQRGFAYYNSAKSRPSYSAAIRPPPTGTKRALNVLFIASIIALIYSFPYFAPPDIFAQTQSRLKIPTNTLFVRLSSISPQPGTLSEYQTALQQHLNSLESRLLYFTYGPNVIAYCKFCDPEDVNSYFYYSIPSILAPHLLHIGILALCTSGLFAGPEARRWRLVATLAGVGLALTELMITGTYNHTDNARAERLGDIFPFFWRMRVYRSIAMSGILALTGFILYQTSTNRWFVEPPPPFQRVDMAAAHVVNSRNIIGQMACVKNAAIRDRTFRARNEEYWLQEADNMAQKHQDQSVREGINNALNERLNMNGIRRDADAAVNMIFAPFEERLRREGESQRKDI